MYNSCIYIKHGTKYIEKKDNKRKLDESQFAQIKVLAKTTEENLNVVICGIYGK